MRPEKTLVVCSVGKRLFLFLVFNSLVYIGLFRILILFYKKN